MDHSLILQIWKIEISADLQSSHKGLKWIQFSKRETFTALIKGLFLKKTLKIFIGILKLSEIIFFFYSNYPRTSIDFVSNWMPWRGNSSRVSQIWRLKNRVTRFRHFSHYRFHTNSTNSGHSHLNRLIWSNWKTVFETSVNNAKVRIYLVQSSWLE